MIERSYSVWNNALGTVFSMDYLNNPPGFKLIIVCTLQIITAIIIYVIVDKRKKDLLSV